MQVSNSLTEHIAETFLEFTTTLRMEKHCMQDMALEYVITILILIGLQKNEVKHASYAEI